LQQTLWKGRMPVLKKMGGIFGIGCNCTLFITCLVSLKNLKYMVYSIRLHFMLYICTSDYLPSGLYSSSSMKEWTQNSGNWMCSHPRMKEWGDACLAGSVRKSGSES
jgi:hypothetical protein